MFSINNNNSKNSRLLTLQEIKDPKSGLDWK